jgi:Ser/Thr protein kinase RdoA (MazF antagonist)
MNSEIKESLSAWGAKETEYFYALTPHKILDAVEHFGFRCTGRSLALNSMENRVYDVEIDIEDEKLPPNSPERFRIIKFYRPGRWSKEQIQEEHSFLFDLVENEIPAVAPIKTEDGTSIFELPEINIFCAVFPKVGGRNPDELTDDQIPLVGRLLARLHNIGGIKNAEHRIQLTPETYGLQSLDYLLDNEILPEHLENRYADVVEDICEACSEDFARVEYQRIHGDCHLGNLLSGKQGLFWVDFDDMVRGPCVQDLWLMFPSRDEFSQEQLKKLIAAYEQMRPFDHKSLRLIEPLRALRMIHFNAWIAKRWEDPAFKNTFVEFGTEKFWNEQIISLDEQLAFIDKQNA